MSAVKAGGCLHIVAADAAVVAATDGDDAIQIHCIGMHRAITFYISIHPFP